MTANSPPESYDLLIINATLIDGTGAERTPGDLAVRGDRIVRMASAGSLDPGRSNRVIDARGKVLCPGFVDTHTHDDNAVLVDPDMVPKISQGVTTVIAGNCGISLAPLKSDDCPPPLNLLGGHNDFKFDSVAEYARAVNSASPSVNVALLVGHSTLRVGAMTDLSVKARPDEIAVMRERLDQAMKDGAIGFSTGLYYKTSEAADMEEVVALAEVIAPYGGVYATHMRNEHEAILDSLDETFTTASRAGIRVIVSHHKCAGPDNWGRSTETLAVIDAASKRQPVGLDVYPYTAGSTVLDPDFIDERYRITVSWSQAYPSMSGRDLADIAAEWGVDQKEAAKRLNPAGGIFYLMHEDDVQRILSYPQSMIGSDGLPHDAHPHPRLWGTFPRVLAHYSRDLGLFSLERAVHKMTGLSAANFGLTDRGVLAEGAIADLVIFDPENVIDSATFETPKRPAAGIEHVIVAGEVSWQSGQHTGTRNGRFIPRQ